MLNLTTAMLGAAMIAMVAYVELFVGSEVATKNTAYTIFGIWMIVTSLRREFDGS